MAAADAKQVAINWHIEREFIRVSITDGNGPQPP